MILADAVETIAQQFFIGWSALHPTIPFRLDNEEFDPPADGSPWLGVSIQPQAATQDSLGPIGSRKFLRIGTIFVQVFATRDGGTREASQLAGDVVSVIEGLQLAGGDLRLYTSSTQSIGPSERWFMFTVSTRFDFQETR